MATESGNTYHSFFLNIAMKMAKDIRPDATPEEMVALAHRMQRVEHLVAMFGRGHDFHSFEVTALVVEEWDRHVSGVRLLLKD